MATPHNGKEADFQLFMALLDGNRFEGRFRDGVHVTDVSDLMRRMVKESLFKFHGTPRQAGMERRNRPGLPALLALRAQEARARGALLQQPGAKLDGNHATGARRETPDDCKTASFLDRMNRIDTKKRRRDARRSADRKDHETR
jgi:hypothetical protein